MADSKKNNYLDSLVTAPQSKPQKEQAAKKRSSDSTVVKVKLFTKKQEINVLKERVKAESVVRQEKIDEIRKLIRNEAYAIDGQLVSRSILKSRLLDELLR